MRLKRKRNAFIRQPAAFASWCGDNLPPQEAATVPLVVAEAAAVPDASCAGAGAGARAGPGAEAAKEAAPGLVSMAIRPSPAVASTVRHLLEFDFDMTLFETPSPESGPG